MNIRARFLGVGLGCLAAAAAPLAPAHAQGPRLSLIRDAEIENTIRQWATPLWASAGLVADDVNVHLINDRRLNAFVAGGQNLFINTGLLVRAEHAGQVVGVIAHETGHISGGHLARLHDQLKNATAQAILALLAGVAVGVLARSPDAGIAGIGAGMTMAERNLFSYTRTQEQSADQAGIAFLEQNGLSPKGMLEFFEILAKQELLVAARQDPYLRTHPLTQERVDFLRNYLRQSRFADAPVPEEWNATHRRIKAKLEGFIDPPSRTLTTYKEDDKSVEARYARAIAYYRKPDIPHALPLIDALIREEPRNPFFHELRGQMLFENQRAADALASYREAARLLPGSGLIRIDLARTLLELNRPELDREAIGHLSEALRQEDRSPMAWRQLAIAHGRSGDMGMAALALGEQAFLQSDFRTAIGQAQRAQGMLPAGSPGWLRAQDLEKNARQERQRQKDNQ